jgi:hypothetical protein
MNNLCCHCGKPIRGKQHDTCDICEKEAHCECLMVQLGTGMRICLSCCELDDEEEQENDDEKQ